MFRKLPARLPIPILLCAEACSGMFVPSSRFDDKDNPPMIPQRYQRALGAILDPPVVTSHLQGSRQHHASPARKSEIRKTVVDQFAETLARPESSMLKAVFNGRADDLVDLARTNLWA